MPGKRKNEIGYALKETIYGDKETRENLLNIKKNIVKEYIEHYKIDEKINDPETKEELENFLTNDGSFEDIINDTFRKYSLSFSGLGEYMGNLNKVRELICSIQNIPTSEELNSLKSEIMSIDPQTNTQSAQTQQSGDQETDGNQIATGAATGVAAGTIASSIDETTDGESTEGSAEIGEAKEVELKQRMNWLFPEGVPQTEKQMKKYLTKIKVPIITENGKTKKLKLYVHKKLANEIKAIFEEMKEAGIKINPDTTACFNWRKMRKGKKMSHHSYGTAIDVNRDVNGGVYGKTDNSSPYFNDQATVDIWKKHGFYWGGDRSAKNNDPMHFTYMNA